MEYFFFYIGRYFDNMPRQRIMFIECKGLFVLGICGLALGFLELLEITQFVGD